MANPQKENGYTPLANEILEAFHKFRLSGNEWQILTVIWRATWAWNKKTFPIAISSFAKKTGLSPGVVCRCLRSLQSKKMVRRTVEKDSRLGICSSYSFNKNYDEWLPSKKTLGVPTVEKDSPLPSVLLSKTKKATVVLDSLKRNSIVVKETKDKIHTPHLFSEDPLFDFSAFQSALSDWSPEEYQYFYDQLVYWSSEHMGKTHGKHINWLLTARNWRNREKQESRGFYSHNGNGRSNLTPTGTFEQINAEHEAMQNDSER